MTAFNTNKMKPLFEAINKRRAVWPDFDNNNEQTTKPQYALPDGPSRVHIVYPSSKPPNMWSVLWWLRVDLRRTWLNPAVLDGGFLSWAQNHEPGVPFSPYSITCWLAKLCDDEDIGQTGFDVSGNLTEVLGYYAEHPTIANRWDRRAESGLSPRYITLDSGVIELRKTEDDALVSSGSYDNKDDFYHWPGVLADGESITARLYKQSRLSDEMHGGPDVLRNFHGLPRMHLQRVYSEIYDMVKRVDHLLIGSHVLGKPALYTVRSATKRSGSGSGATWEDAKAAAVAAEQEEEVSASRTFFVRARGRRTFSPRTYYAEYVTYSNIRLGFPSFVRDSEYLVNSWLAGKADRLGVGYSVQGLSWPGADGVWAELSMTDGLSANIGAGPGPGPAEWPSKPTSSSFRTVGAEIADLRAVAKFDFEDEE